MSPTVGVTGPGSSPNTDIKYASYEMIVTDGGPSGGPCLTTGYEGADSRFPECSARPTPEGVPATPAGYAASYWRDVPLPAPEPHIAPGRAITGMPAYLETRGATTHTFIAADTPFGPLTIEATGAYFVDWGDGATTGPHSSEGQPWPEGRITHQYIDVGSYEVVVTERWTATWSFGDRSGSLEELRTIGRIDDFPVEQIQAVVLR